MKFDVKLSSTAVKQLNRVAEDMITLIKKHLSELKNDPFQKRPLADIKKLKDFTNPSLYRLRIGEYRAIYTVTEKEVLVTEVFHRSKGYDWIN